jgi:hypothetical protein
MRLPPTAHPEELELWFAKTQRARARGKSREIKKLLEIPLEWFKLGGSRQPVPNYKKYFSFILFCLYTYFFFFLYMRTNRHAISRAQWRVTHEAAYDLNRIIFSYPSSVFSATHYSPNPPLLSTLPLM